MAMDQASLSSQMPMYDPRRSNNLNHPKPDSTVPSPPADKVEAGGASSDTLADLANTEISLDLQGLIDDDHFSADAENLFSDLTDFRGHGGGHGGHKRDFVSLSPVNSLGSSANSSPGEHHHHHPQDSPPSFSSPYRSSLAYLPGSVHGGSMATSTASSLPSITTLNNAAVFVKQEPTENDQLLKRQQHHMQQQQQQHNTGQTTFVSSTTHMNYANCPNPTIPSARPHPSQVQAQQPKNFPHGAGSAPGAGPKPYPNQNTSKKKVDRNSDEYRRRRERNNVAVRKSREKAKMRTRETEDRVKILARENERLQKKVELLQEELAVLRSLFSNVGVLPDHIHRELSKHIDNFQAQHNAMACM